MRPFLRPFAIATCSLVAFAGEAAPLVDLRIDGPRLAEHWPASIYAKLWNDPAFAPFRKQWDDGMAAAKTTSGVDITSVISVLRIYARLDSLVAGPDGKPKLGGFAQADLGAQAATLFALATKNAAARVKPVTVAGADAALGDADAVVARFGSTLVIAPTGTTPAPVPFPAATDDISASGDALGVIDAVRPLLPPEQRAEFESNLALMRSWYQGRISYRANLVPEGVLETFANTAPRQPWMLPVDRALLDRLPATALIAGATALDGAEYWKLLRPAILNAMRRQATAAGGEMTEEQAQLAMDSGLKSFGLTCTVKELISGLTGTMLLAITPSMPFPAATIAVPRSPALDQVIGMLLGQMKTALPAEGAAASVIIPNIGIAVQVLRAPKHWVLTSDPVLATTWIGAKPGGWSTAPAGALALAKAPTDAFVIGASDTPAVLRNLLPYLGMGLTFAKDLTPEQRNAIVQLTTRLAAIAGTGYVVGGTRDGAQITEMRGLVGFAAMPAIIAAIAIPSLLESRNSANEAAAAASLKSGLFPAEILFQSGAYHDADGDNVGEFGLLSEISGRRGAGQIKPGELSFVAGPLARGDEANGYRFAVWLPDGAGGAVGEPAGGDPRPAKPAAANAQERRFVIYAWPSAAGQGATMFALTPDGEVRSAPWTGEAPAWNALFGGQGWEAAPTWPKYAK